MRFFWLTLGWLSVVLGAAGAVLPLLPSVPFLLLAAFAFARGSQRAHQWLTTHPHFGPPIEQWQRYRAISRGTKWVASLALLASLALGFAFELPVAAMVFQAAVLLGIAIFIWRCNEPP